MKPQIATTIKQSARLIACGIKSETADMSIDIDTDKHYLNPYSERVDNAYEAPAWSLSFLLALLPKEINIDGYTYCISIYFENPDESVIGNQWCLCYKPKKHNERSRIDDVPMYAPDLIECAVLMTEWLTDNGYELNYIR